MAARVRAVVWSDAARNALDEVIEYIAKDSRPAAMRVLDAALDAAQRLAAFPQRARVVPEVNQEAIREVFVFRYRLMYRVESTRVVVVAFLHGARDFALWRDDHDVEQL
jgi:toxin ParE1/3/4